MTDDDGTTGELRMKLADHVASILDDLEMNDENQASMTDEEIVEMHERNAGLAAFLLDSMGLYGASNDEYGWIVRVNPTDPHDYVDKHLR